MTGLRSVSTTKNCKAMENALKQYIELHDEHGEMLARTSAPAMSRPRREARTRLAGARLPRRGDEGYAVTDLGAMFAPDYGVNLSRMPFRSDVAAAFKCEVPNISTLLGVVSNDVFAPTSALLRLLPTGVTVCTFGNADKVCPGVLEKYYDRLTDKDNVAQSLNTLLAQDGVLLHVAAGVKCQRTIQLLNILGNVNVPLLAFRRLLVVLEDDSECAVLTCDHAIRDGIGNASSTVTEIVLGDRAVLHWHDIEESDAATMRYASYVVGMGAGSRFDMGLTTLRCGTVRNEISVTMNGEGAECLLNGMAIIDGMQHADNSTFVRHAAAHCHSNQLFKYVADDKAQGAFEGLILVDEGAHHTDAYQNNRNMLASSTAKVHTQPQLEIYCDDVKCSHGAATGQLDAEALFYMRSRGIDLATARTMLMQAFMADIIDAVRLEPLRDRLRHLVEHRLSGASMASDCAACSSNTSFTV